MCILLKVANRRPVDLISPFLVDEEQITSVGSIGDNSAALVRFSCTVRIFSMLSAFFTRFPRFGTFAVCAALRPRWFSSATHPQRVADADHESCGLFAHHYSRCKKSYGALVALWKAVRRGRWRVAMCKLASVFIFCVITVVATGL